MKKEFLQEREEMFNKSLQIIKDELKKVKYEVLNLELPVWIDFSPLQDECSKDRLDNNFFNPGYEFALETLEKLVNSRKILVEKFGFIINRLLTGRGPDENGEHPLVEGINVQPNYIFPTFEKMGIVNDENDEVIIKADDILFVKDGSPGVACWVSEELLKVLLEKLETEYLIVSTHVYRIELKEEYKEFAPYVSMFLNSKIGQAIVRRYISGSVSPTIRKNDIKNIIVALPIEEECEKLKQQMIDFQLKIASILDTSDISNIFNKSFDIHIQEMPKLPVNWMPGGRRDPHGYYK